MNYQYNKYPLKPLFFKFGQDFMQGFQQILAEAAQLKEHQLKKERKTYQSLPDFIKAGLGYEKKYKQVRKQHFLFQYRVSLKIKEEGNTKFKQKLFDEALHKYQESLCIFRYIESKSYQDMKDEDIQYRNLDSSQLNERFLKIFEEHMKALYLNISSCLSKIGKKDDAIFSAEEAMKIERKNPKAHYKKAQAYLQDMNRGKDDIRLAILELKEAYNLTNDSFFIKEMHQAKRSFETDKEKSKSWFKNMFDKKDHEGSQQEKESSSRAEESKKPQLSEEYQKIKQIQTNEVKKLEQSKVILLKYISEKEENWQNVFQNDFMKKYGSKIYSILKIQGYEEEAYQYRSLLAKSLEKKQSETISNNNNASQWLAWLRNHPYESIRKYIERYDLQTNWIKRQREKGSIDDDKNADNMNEQNKIKAESVPQRLEKGNENEMIKQKQKDSEEKKEQTRQSPQVVAMKETEDKLGSLFYIVVALLLLSGLGKILL